MTEQTTTSQPAVDRSKLSRKTLKALGRKKRIAKLRTNPDFRKAYFEGRSKRSNDKKVAYRKRHAKKTT